MCRTEEEIRKTLNIPFPDSQKPMENLSMGVGGVSLPILFPWYEIFSCILQNTEKSAFI